MDLSGRKVAVVGLGRSGKAAAALCLAKGASVRGHDEAVVTADFEVTTGSLDEADLSWADLVVVSPGVPNKSAIRAFEAAGGEVIGELELASRFASAPMILVGGTNGKSTVTRLLADMLSASGKNAVPCGNYGTPVSELILGSESPDVLVVEISSFQAERVPTLHARGHVLLNVSDDHLDRYATFADYAAAKGNPFACMLPDDIGVVPVNDEVCRRQAQRGKASILTFGPGGHAEVGDEGIVDHHHGDSYPRAQINLHGRHNLNNAAAALLMARALGAPTSGIRTALAGFEPLPHRLAFVRELAGVRYYDDSKATNVGAAVAALEGMEEERVVLVAGGRDKHGSYAPLLAALERRGRGVVLIGEAADRLQTSLTPAIAAGLRVARADSMAAAVKHAAGLAHPGDAVLLSPACSSFDMYTSYAARGDAFVAAVEALEANEEP